MMGKILMVCVAIFGGLIFAYDHESLAGQTLSLDELFQKANTLYSQGAWKDAFREYKKILEYGGESGNLYFNIGNCYVKEKQLGKAVVYYTYARRLMPRDPDLIANYRFVQTMLNIKDTYEGKNQISYYFSDLPCTVNELTLVIQIIYFFCIILLIIRMIRPSSHRWCIIFGVFLALGLISSSMALYAKINLIRHEGIVITQQVEVKFEPMESAVKYFSVGEGTCLKVIDEKNFWVKVMRRDGKQGWLPRENVEII